MVLDGWQGPCTINDGFAIHSKGYPMPARQKPAKKSSKRRLTYTVTEASELLGIGLNQTYEAVHSGAIPSIRVGVRWLIPQAALEKKLNCEPSTR